MLSVLAGGFRWKGIGNRFFVLGQREPVGLRSVNCALKHLEGIMGSYHAVWLHFLISWSEGPVYCRLMSRNFFEVE